MSNGLEGKSDEGRGIENSRDISGLTPRQRQILEFIDGYAGERGFPPTIREIQNAVGLRSTSSVHAQLKNLEEAGHIKREPSRRRALGITYQSRRQGPEAFSLGVLSIRTKPTCDVESVVEIPLVGRIAAGQPLQSFELEAEDAIPVPAGVFPELKVDDAESGNIFFLRVSGDSMVGAGINEGDLVLVRRQITARSGEIVVAEVWGETTVKRLRISKTKIGLEPENPFYSVIEADPEEVRIIGKVIGLIRPIVA